MRPVDERDDQQGSPPWIWAALVALALVTVTVGAIVGMVTTDDDQGQGAVNGETAAVQTTVEAPSNVLPPTVPVPPISDVVPTTDSGITFPSTTDTGGATATVPTASGTWPSGTSGWTVVLASVAESQGRAEADSIAQRATAAGLPQVGVLDSSDFSSLRPGYWVTYSGVYAAEAEARGALPRAQAAGFPAAYPRRVAP